jgi:outer membrane assembly lipoprotein YfgL
MKTQLFSSFRPWVFMQGLARWLTLCALATLGACSSLDKPEPKALQEIASPLPVTVLWQQSTGASVSFALKVDVRGDVITLANDDGWVISYDAQTGAEYWRVQLDSPPLAGVGSDGQSYAVVTRSGELVVIRDAAIAWRKPIDSRVVTAPLVAGGRVFLLATNRSVSAFDATDGASLWQIPSAGDPLTLSQSGVLNPQGNTLVVGSGRKLAGLNPIDGAVQWEATLASPRGTNEVERLADLVGPAARSGKLHCARSFQNTVACVDGARGVLLWSKNFPGGEPVAADEKLVVAADATSRVAAWRLATGEELWSRDDLVHRELSAPALMGERLVFGDMDGQLHFLDRNTGQAVARIETEANPIRIPPVVVGGRVVVINDAGAIFVLQP